MPRVGVKTPTGLRSGRYKERRKVEYWWYREHNLCVDCGSADFRTISGLCRCEICQKKHTAAKSSYGYKIQGAHLVGSGRRSWH